MVAGDENGLFLRYGSKDYIRVQTGTREKITSVCDRTTKCVTIDRTTTIHSAGCELPWDSISVLVVQAVDFQRPRTTALPGNLRQYIVWIGQHDVSM